MDEDELDISNPFGNLKPAPLPVYTQPKHELITDQKNELSKLLTGLTPAQETEIALFMEKMRWGINGVTPITCKDEDCPYYTKCALVRADIPRPKGKDCPIEVSLVQSWLNEFIGTSGVELRSLSAYDMLILQDIAYQQLLEARAAMELADNPLIQVKTFIGTDPNDGNPMYTYTLNNLITFREKSNKMKMKLLQEMIATAKAKSQEERGKQDRSSETAERLKRIEEKLGADKITSKAIDAVFKSKEIK